MNCSENYMLATDSAPKNVGKNNSNSAKKFKSKIKTTTPKPCLQPI